MASTVISTSANPIERHSMVRIGGDRICESALTAASNMAVLPLVIKPSREVDTSKGFGKSLPAPGETRLSSKTTPHEAAMTRVQELYPDNKIVLREVGLRDGLQLVKTFPSTEAKQRWMRDEYAAGVRHFEVGSFLPAKTFPQFADVRDIVATVAALPGAYGIALALNERGVNEALASGVAEVASVVSATEEHSQANANRSRESAIANVRRLCELRDASAHKPVVNAAISMALGCSITGDVDPNEVVRLAERLYEVGVDMVAVADTVGYAGPKQVGELTKAVVKIAGAKPVCVHLHDTRGKIGRASCRGS